ncbi:hypothetical protein [Actinomadura hibisca]|uniref:hypothetical protein n=1 Tax=Actinomadura hibisca TaxID=68565 RepID=UPI00082A4C04|nr:hypothetical protein [Actinomadura hibisca]
MTVQRPIALAGSAAACLALAACGASGGAAQSPGGGGGEAAAAAPAAPAAPTALRVVPTGTLGRIVIDSAGRTLYRFDRDSARPPAATCAGACARMWPPAVWREGLKATDLDPAQVGRVRRADGTWQVTVGGWPMYRYARDSAPGDVTGQGMGGAWFASTATGAKARSAPDVPVPPTGADTPAGNGGTRPTSAPPDMPPMPGMDMGY